MGTKEKPFVVVIQERPVPPELKSCPAAPQPVPVPPTPRTYDTLVAWGRLSDERRAETAKALETCRAKLTALGQWAVEVQ